MGEDYQYREYLYARQLYEDGVISENTFSFLLTNTPWVSGESYIDFGAPNTSVMTSEDDIVWINSTTYGGWWTNYVTGWRWSGSETEYAVTTRWALTDTGSSCILGPSETVDYWREEVFASIQGVRYTSDAWGYVFRCEERTYMPEFDILFGGYWFPVHPDDYITEINTTGWCGVCLDGTSSDYWLLG